MAIAYPLLTLPRAPRNVEFSIRRAKAASQSPFTLQKQVLLYRGDLWLAVFEYPAMERADGDDLVAAIWGQEDVQFYLGPTEERKTPRGIATGTPKVDGASQIGYTLATKGWTPNITGILKRGDWFQYSTYLNRVAQDASSNGSGLASIELVHRIQASPADSADIYVNSPGGVFRLAGQPPAQRINEYRHSYVVLEAEEVLATA